jgi:hypothetical protein
MHTLSAVLSSIFRPDRLRIAIGALAMLATSGCAQYIAYSQPAPIDRDALAIGVDRSRVAGLLGAPIQQEVNSDGTETDVYKYKDGGKKNHAVSKTGRILVYTAGDFFTLFLDQVISMPLELAFRGTDYTADVTYEKEGYDWRAISIKEIAVEDNEVTKQVSITPRGTEVVREQPAPAAPVVGLPEHVVPAAVPASAPKVGSAAAP